MIPTERSDLKLPPLATFVLVVWFAVVAWLAAGDAFVAGAASCPGS